MGFGGSQLTSNAEEFLFLLCPPVVSLQRCSYLEASTWGDPEGPLYLLSWHIQYVLHPIRGAPPIRASEVFLALKVIETELAGLGSGVTGWEGLLCV